MHFLLFTLVFCMRLTIVCFYGLLIYLFTQSGCSPIFYNGFATNRYVTLLQVDKSQPKPTSRPNSCADYLNYIPDTLHPEFTPMRYVRINCHFVNSTDSTQNFSEQEATLFVKELLNFVNYNLAHNQPMFLPSGNNTPVLPTQYRFVLQGEPDNTNDSGIYFHYNDTLFICNKKENRQRNPFSLFHAGQFDRFGLRKGEVTNVFFLEHPPDSLGSATYKFTTNGVGKPDWAKIIGAYYHYRHRFQDQPNPLQFTASFIAGLFNHELGHSLGLAHTWNQNDGCDDTPQHPNYWNYPDAPEDKQDQISNNVMDYNAYENAWSPCQIGKIHLNCSSNSTLQRRLLLPDWCTYKPDATIHINGGDTVEWLGAKDFAGDIIVHNRAQLTLRCNLSLPQGAGIKVCKRGTLFIDGGTITNTCNQKWQGIKVRGGIFTKSKIILQRNAQVLNAEHSIWRIEKGRKKNKPTKN